MNILFFSHYFPPEGNAPASRTHENCKRWVKAGHQVDIITCEPNVPNGVIYPGYRNHWRHREVIDGINVLRVWTYIASNEGTFLRIVNYVSYMISALLAMLPRSKPDIVIATSPQFFCGWAGVIYSWVRRVPFVLEIRDIWPESILVLGAIRNKLIIKFIEYFERKMYASADKIVTVGEGYKRKLIEKGVPGENIDVVMNGIDRKFFVPRDPNLDLKGKLSISNKFVCSYIGTIGMACGLDVVIRAGEILKKKNRNDIVFLLVGDGAVRAELEAEAKQKNLNNVIFAGLIDKNKIPDYLSISDACLVHLKKAELFTSVMPSKIFEAAGMRRAIINGVSGFAAEFVTKANAGILMEPDNENELVRACERLADNPEECKKYGQSGYEYVVNNYDRETLAENYLKILKNM